MRTPPPGLLKIFVLVSFQLVGSFSGKTRRYTGQKNEKGSRSRNILLLLRLKIDGIALAFQGSRRGGYKMVPTTACWLVRELQCLASKSETDLLCRDVAAQRREESRVNKIDVVGFRKRPYTGSSERRERSDVSSLRSYGK